MSIGGKPEVTFGTFLKELREEKGLKLRELARLSKQDPAYIYRLESGERTSPSDDVLRTLVRSLKPDERREHIFWLLAERGEVSDSLVSLVLQDEKIVIEDFESAARASFRENPPSTGEQWRKYIDRIRRAREAIESG